MAKLIRNVFATSAVISTGSLYYIAKDEKYERTVKLWTKLGPIITHYRMVELYQKLLKPIPEDADAQWNRLHELYSGKVMESLRDLRGFYIKVAQVMANRPDILPDIYISKLRQLEDQVPHLLTGEKVRDFVCESLNLKSIDEAFVNFDNEPIGSASIGQVHKAYLRNGKPVAIKVQSPGAEKLFKGDLKTAKGFCETFAPEQVAILDEIEKQFVNEFDFVKEAKHLEKVSKNMVRFRNVIVPRPYHEFCSKDVLTMEFLNGPKLIDGIRENAKEYAKTIGKNIEDLEKEMIKEFDQFGLPPVYNGPSSFQLEVYRNSLKLRDLLLNAPRYFINGTLGMLFFMTRLSIFDTKLSYVKSFIPLNSSFIMDTLLKVHGHQILMDGYFNADCHPGNFLLIPDGKIAMIDYGQIKTLTYEERKTLARLIIAIASKDREQIVQNFKDTGFKSKYFNEEVMHKMAIVTLDQDGRNVTDGLNLQQFIDKMFATDPWEKSAEYMVMPIRVSLLLRGLGLMLNHPVSVCTAWAPIAEIFLKDSGEKI